MTPTLATALNCNETIDGGLQAIFKPVENDFLAVNQLIPEQLTSDVPLIGEMGKYIVESGGKRLRPLIVLLTSRACGYQAQQHITLATLVEFLHTATLLHDDVVDKSTRRRGKTTANTIWGNAPSVLVGDFLYSRAFQLMVDLDNMDLMAIISNATNLIAEGEVLQLANVGNADLTETEYTKIITHKSALLFQAAAHTAAILATENTDTISHMKKYGLHFGLAFQLIDDWLDYAGNSELMGKNVGDDLSEGKATLPLIHTMKCGSSPDIQLVKAAIINKSSEDLNNVIDAVRRSGALDYTKSRAIEEVQLALSELNILPKNRYSEALEALGHFAISRMQ